MDSWCSNQQIERLQRLQNKAMRFILNCSRYTSMQYMMESLKWFKQRLKLNTLKYIKKIINGNVPQYIKDQIAYVGEMRAYHLRNNSNFRIDFRIGVAMQHSLFYNGLQLFNQMPDYVKNESNNSIFKKNVVTLVKNNVI